MAKLIKLIKNPIIKKTPRLYLYKVKLVEKIKENPKKMYSRQKEKQELKKKWDI